MLWVNHSFVGRRKILSKRFCLAFLKTNFKSWNIVFFGSDNYSMISLKALHELQMKQEVINSMEIVVLNERNPVYKYAKANDIQVHFWPPCLNNLYDFGVIVSFGKFIPKSIIEKFPLGIINVHASLLPKYRGGMPLVHAVKNGETLSGITVTRISHDKFDSGEIILQKPCTIDKNELMPSLYRKMAHAGCECLLTVINSMPECFKKSFTQSEEDATYAPKLKQESAIIKWDSMTALEVFNLYRALFGTYALKSTWQGKTVKFVCMSLSDSASEDRKLEPGNFSFCKKSRFLYVQCQDKPITVCTIKYNGIMMKATDFYSGFLHKISKTLWKFES